MPLILNGLPPLHWAFAGIGIAGVTLALLFVCSLVMRVPYFQRGAVVSGRAWRLPLLAGLVIGGFLSAVAGGGWEPTWELGVFDRAIGLGPAGKVAWMFAAGLCIGFGTRLAGGCTSGHGIFGLANFEMPSLITTVSFMLAGIATTHIVYRVFFPLVGGL